MCRTVIIFQCGQQTRSLIGLRYNVIFYISESNKTFPEMADSQFMSNDIVTHCILNARAVIDVCKI